jgi:outer membrane biosynthesis protein TonB
MESLEQEFGAIVNTFAEHIRMPLNVWFQKLKMFNEGGTVYAIPRKDTPERAILDARKKFEYTLLNQPGEKKPEPKPEPKKEEPKPEPKKEEPKPEPKKEEPKPEPKKKEKKVIPVSERNNQFTKEHYNEKYAKSMISNFAREYTEYELNNLKEEWNHQTAYSGYSTQTKQGYMISIQYAIDKKMAKIEDFIPYIQKAYGKWVKMGYAYKGYEGHR